jgi:hypothetical protein
VSLHAPAELPVFLQLGRAETRVLVLRDERGGQASPTGGTYTLRDGNGTAVVDAAAIAVSGNGVPYYELLATFGAAYELPLHPWSEEWALTGITGQDASSQTVPLEVMVCRTAPVRHLDIDKLVGMHEEWKRVKESRIDFFRRKIETAWEEMIRRLLGDGHLPSRILNWWTLGTVHRYWAATLVCDDWATDVAEATRWERRRDDYLKRYTELYEHHTALQLDRDEDGVADTPGQKEAAEPPLYLTDVPASGGWWGGDP